MKTPPFLMAACVLFWGWQSDFFLASAAMALILEGARCTKARWEMSDADFTRVWNFCALLGLVAAVFAFTNNDGPTDFGKMWDNPNFQSSRQAGNASTQAAITLVRWLPFIFFFLAAAQVYSSRPEFPLETLSPYLRYRRSLLVKNRRPAPRSHHFNVSYPYFVLCLYAASAHAAEPGDHTFFWGLSGLMAWALWARRPPGFSWVVWLATLGLVMVTTFCGQHGLRQLSRVIQYLDNYDAKWFNHWVRQTNPSQSVTDMGQVGRMQLSPQIVMRVTPINGTSIPTYLREASYRIYNSPLHSTAPPFWAVNVAGGRNDFSSIVETPVNSEHWLLQTVPTAPPLVNISCYLEGFNREDRFSQGLLPLPVDCDHLEQCPAFILQMNDMGAVLAEGPPFLSYNAGFGSNRTVDAPPDTNAVAELNKDLNVPARERRALDEIINKLALTNLTCTQTLDLVSHYFSANYEYGIWQEPPKLTATNETVLSDFLRHTHRGHCEYFATAAVLLLRELHIPARYAVGYYVHEISGHHYVVRMRDAHAWCIVWNAHDHAWQTFDTTPDSWLEKEGRRASAWQFVSDMFSWLHYQFASFRYGQSHLRPYLLWILVPILGYYLYQIIFHNRRHRPQGAGKAGPAGGWPGLDSEFYLLEQTLARRGLVRRPGQSLSDWLQQAAGDPAVARVREPLRHLLRLHYRHRFDPCGLTPDERAELSRQAKACLATISTG